MMKFGETYKVEFIIDEETAEHCYVIITSVILPSEVGGFDCFVGLTCLDNGNRFTEYFPYDEELFFDTDEEVQADFLAFLKEEDITIKRVYYDEYMAYIKERNK